MSSGWRSRWLGQLGIGAGYAALAVALTWPLATAAGSRLPLGTESVSAVPILNAWTVWWNADRARDGFSDYWQAPIFAPARYAFAFSEAQPTTLVVAPLVNAAGPPLAYNVYLLGVLTLNGVATCGLLRRVGLAPTAAALGGAMAEALPFVHWQLGVLQLTTLCGVVWVIDRLVALRDGPTAGNAVLLGVAAAVCYAACNYWGLFLSVLLPLSCTPLLWGRWRDLRFWGFASCAGLVAGGLASPIAWAQWEAKSRYEWRREESLLFDLSAKPRDYATTPWPPAVRALDPAGLKDAERPLWMLGPGTAKGALAAAGIAAGLLTRGRRRWTLFLAAMAGWAFVLSLGVRLDFIGGWRPHVRLHPDVAARWVPYRWLMKAHPGLGLARSPFRFSFFVQLAVVLLAANAVEGVWAGVRRVVKDWRPRVRKAGVAIGSASAVAIGLFATAEVWPARQRLFVPPSLGRAWIGWVREETEPGRPILALPFPAGDRVEDYEQTALFMYEQIGHGRPLLQGYSGFFPDEFLDLKERMGSFPADPLLDDLFARGVRQVVATTPEWVAKAEGSPRCRLDFRDEDAKVSVYSLLPSGPAGDDRATPP